MKEITLACEAFQKLLGEQLERIRNMNGEKTDFSTKKQVTIGVIDGDGIGPVITAQATRVLEKLLAEEIAAGSIVIKQIEGLTIENRMACGVGACLGCVTRTTGEWPVADKRHGLVQTCNHGPVFWANQIEL